MTRCCHILAVQYRSKGGYDMPTENSYLSDIEEILLHRHDNGGDYWATLDKRLLKGAPFTTIESPLYLLELGVSADDPVMRGTANLIFSTWKEDGRFKIFPTGSVYPCQTAEAARTLCYMGYVNDSRIETTFQYLLNTQYTDGGWRCNKFSFGRGPETEYSNPHPTLIALDAFRFSHYLNREPALDHAVEFLLNHWILRKPIGPCHYGIGTLFMQVEYPFRNYNLFQYVYVLSFYNRAKNDNRFLEAFNTLKAKTQDNQIVVERVVPKLGKLSFCKKGKTSILATKRYNEILFNLEH